MKSDELKMLLVEDSRSFRQGVTQLLGVYTDIDAVGDLASARQALANTAYDVVILDKGLPDGDGVTLIPEIKTESPNTVVIVVTADGDFNSAKKCMLTGADDYVVKSENVIADLLVRLPFVVERAADRRQLRSLKEQVREAFKYEIIGKSRATTRLREQISIVGKATSSNVLITGESGTGKELIAHRLNALAEEKQRPFVVINCGAIPMSLIEAELFGHQKGTFTGAIADRPGKFELAHKGDIFLDEIGDLSFEAQGKLLRVIQDGCFYRVGGTKPIQSSCRVIAATNSNLEELIRKRQFREDLYYRINVVRIQTTPLRDRMDDIPDLARHFCLNLAGVYISISEAGIKRLHQHDWPGNVRELRNTLERAILQVRHRRSNQVGPEDISTDQLVGPNAGIRKLESLLPSDSSTLREDNYRYFMELAERIYLQAALDAMNGNVVETGVKLGMARSTVFKKLAQLRIPRRPYEYRREENGSDLMLLGTGPGGTLKRIQ